MKQDQQSCDLKNNCKHIKLAEQEAREKERVAHYTVELVVVACIIIVMALAWKGSG
jgi:hypothetical protein